MSVAENVHDVDDQLAFARSALSDDRDDRIVGDLRISNIVLILTCWINNVDSSMAMRTAAKSHFLNLNGSSMVYLTDV